ncbi:molybdopterin molybdenumtransferase MoeA [Erythrobacter vulgaris]|uniref:Molybdopterin molybdenumtransferase n=1 Tax=Qipengyuania vulgaris TaxID=291985 RepID=A0A844XTK6_9SPHN|nr:molybdopterin molybdotransferase MoeA [Qipengyuania vulgaris]MXO48774.1 molybdopterin molybdenumtransferase MoeA [Qipengyuania vulgaris]
MLSFDEAIVLLAENIRPLGAETVALEQSAGRFLAEDLRARSDAPRTDVAIMDGYAVLRAAAAADDSLSVIGEARPGAPYKGRLEAGEAVRIFTGAAIPDGADCVIMQEHAVRDGKKVTFASGHGPARHIRKAASDFRAGEVLLTSGTRLNPSVLVTGSAADRARVMVARRPRVAIIATGDELTPPGEASLTDSGIPDSVSYAIAALCEQSGAEVVSRLRCGDNLSDLAKYADEAVTEADCIIVTGGASVGDHDLARPMFSETGLNLVFSKLAIKPGRPVWFGLSGSKPVLGLPGNPTSAMVTARLFLRPLLSALQGGEIAHELEFVRLNLASPLPETGNRETFVRAFWSPAGLMPIGNQQSGAQAPLATANWLIRRPAGSAAVAPETSVDALPF